MMFFQQIAKNTIVQILGRVGVIATTIITTAILTRLLGISGYGNYVFIVSLLMFFVTLADWGTGLIFVREATKNDSDQHHFFGNALIFRLITSLVCLFVLNGLIILLPELRPLASPLRIASLILIFISIKTSSSIVFQTKLKFEFMAMVEVIISSLFLLSLLLLFIFSKKSINLDIVFTIFLLVNIIGSAISFYWSKKLASYTCRVDTKLIRQILVESLPTGALLLIFSIYNRIDIIILQLLKGSDAVGVYGLAYKVHDNLILGAAYLAGSLFPIISKFAISQNGSSENLKNIYQKIFHLLVFFGGIMFLGTFILSPMIIQIIGGPDFLPSVTILRILIFATFISYFNHLTGYTLIALGKQRVSLLIAVITLLWNVSLNILLIPYFSYIASAMITISTELLVFILTSIYLSKKYSLSPSLAVFKTIKDLFLLKGKIF